MPLSNNLNSSLIISDIYLQAHGAIIVPFHPEVFRVSLFIFSQRKAFIDLESRMDMNLNNNACKYTNIYSKGKYGDLKIVDTHLGIPLRIKWKTKNKRIILS